MRTGSNSRDAPETPWDELVSSKFVGAVRRRCARRTLEMYHAILLGPVVIGFVGLRWGGLLAAAVGSLSTLFFTVPGALVIAFAHQHAELRPGRRHPIRSSWGRLHRTIGFCISIYTVIFMLSLYPAWHSAIRYGIDTQTVIGVALLGFTGIRIASLVWELRGVRGAMLEIKEVPLPRRRRAAPP